MGDAFFLTAFAGTFADFFTPTDVADFQGIYSFVPARCCAFQAPIFCGVSVGSFRYLRLLLFGFSSRSAFPRRNGTNSGKTPSLEARCLMLCACNDTWQWQIIRNSGFAIAAHVAISQSPKNHPNAPLCMVVFRISLEKRFFFAALRVLPIEVFLLRECSVLAGTFVVSI